MSVASKKHASLLAPVLGLSLAACLPARAPMEPGAARAQAALDPRGAEACEPSAREHASRLFADGLEALDAASRGEALDEVALDLFRMAYARCPTRRALWNVVLGEMYLGKKADACRHLETYLADPTGLSAAREQEANDRRRALEEELTWLDVEVDALGASVLVDGVPSERQARVEPGTHIVRVIAPGRSLVEVTVSSKPCERRRLSLKLPPVPNPQRQTGLAMVGVGTAGLVVAGVLGGEALFLEVKKSTYCPLGGCVSIVHKEEYEKLGREQGQLAAGATSLFVVGAAVVGFGAIVALTSRRADPVKSPAATLLPVGGLVPVQGGAAGVLGIGGKW